MLPDALKAHRADCLSGQWRFWLAVYMLFVLAPAGTGKDGGPNCATVKPFGGWKLRGGH